MYMCPRALHTHYATQHRLWAISGAAQTTNKREAAAHCLQLLWGGVNIQLSACPCCSFHQGQAGGHAHAGGCLKAQAFKPPGERPVPARALPMAAYTAGCPNGVTPADREEMLESHWEAGTHNTRPSQPPYCVVVLQGLVSAHLPFPGSPKKTPRGMHWGGRMVATKQRGLHWLSTPRASQEVTLRPPRSGPTATHKHRHNKTHSSRRPHSLLPRVSWEVCHQVRRAPTRACTTAVTHLTLPLSATQPVGPAGS